jgi:hypothetical protein
MLICQQKLIFHKLVHRWADLQLSDAHGDEDEVIEMCAIALPPKILLPKLEAKHCPQ